MTIVVKMEDVMITECLKIEGWIWVLITSVPGHCLIVASKSFNSSISTYQYAEIRIFVYRV